MSYVHRSATMVLSSRVIFLVLFYSTVCLAVGNEESGPYKFSITQMKRCNDPGTNDIDYEVMTEYQDGDTKRPCFTGNINLKRDVNDELTYKVSVDIMEKATWKEYMNFNFKKGCSDTKKYEPNWFQMMNKMNINATDCPIPKGFYSFKCVSFDGQQLKSQRTMKYSRYRVFKSFWDKDTMVGCLYVELIASPS